MTELELLKQKVDDLSFQLERERAVNQINNIMGRYAFYYQAQEYMTCADLWARRDDSMVDVGLGVYTGYEDIKKAYRKESVGHGLFRIHLMTSPVIEVAEDGKTARGVFFSPGIDTAPFGPKGGSASWCWIKYGADFIKEDGTWYLWHFMAYGLFHSDYYQSWLDKPKQGLNFQCFAPPGQPRPPMPDRHDWHYSVDRLPELDPVPPKPYESWDEAFPLGCHQECPDPERGYDPNAGPKF